MRHRTSFLIAVVTLAACAGALVASPYASAQNAPPRAAPGQRPPAAPASLDENRVLGVLAWRSAVWSSDPAMYARAAQKFKAILDLGGAPDSTILFLLGHSLARGGFVASSEAHMKEAGRLAPDFPGHILSIAVQISSEQAAYVKQPRTAEAVALLDRYLTEIARYDRKAPFAAELRYLGHLERGLRLYALNQDDAAIRDFDEAAAIARIEGHEPSLELVRVLLQAHKNVLQFTAAAKIVEDSIRRDPGEVSHYYLLGLIDAENRKLAEAKVVQHQALDRKPNYAESHAKLAYIAWLDHDLDAMRRHIESFEAYWVSRWKSDAGETQLGTQANILSAYGAYWQARGDRLSEGDDREGARRMWNRARECYLGAVAKSRDCLRALTNLVEVLTLLEAPAAEIEEWNQKAETIREMRHKGVEPYHDTFC